jgi:transposase InsO family protein
LPVGERGFLYLATVIDLHSRRLAGWAIADHMRTDLVVDALHAAQCTRGSLDGAIMHTDHGAQGEFNRSSQHLDPGGSDGARQETDA